jgi:preprotein translocase subunit SecG
MAASFGGVSSSASSFLGTRQAGNLLTKASWWCGGLFLGLSFLLALASTRGRAPKSVLDQTFTRHRRARRAMTGGANPRFLTDAGQPEHDGANDPTAGQRAASGAASGTKKGAAPTAPAPKKP